jgi:hypothetical protein
MGQWKQFSAIANLSKKAATRAAFISIRREGPTSSGMRELAADAIEARLLLAAQRPIKVIERRLHRTKADSCHFEA